MHPTKTLLTAIFVLIFLSISQNTKAQTPTWSNEIACIVYNNCVQCHRPNGVAPFSLLEYNNAYTFRHLIQYVVTEKLMPPFPAEEDLVDYLDEMALSDDEIDLINDWVEADAPQGNPDDAPTPPVLPDGDIITNPDMVIQMPVYESQAVFTDDYRCFVVPSNLTGERYIIGMEVVPGNQNILHHVLVYADNSNFAYTLDNLSPGPGYTCFGGPGSGSANLIGGWVPGQSVNYFPSGFGIKIDAGTNIIVQTHYPEGSQGQRDSTKINFIFADDVSNIREAFMTPILTHETTMTDGPLYIPANETRTFHQEFNVFANATIFSVLPHMHLIGRSMKADLRKASGEVIPLFDIPKWDFEWQLDYKYNQPIIATFGSRLRAEAFYDNTTANPINPNNPPQDVSSGEATTDEMMIVFFTWSVYQTGDENMYLEDAPPLLPNCNSTGVNTLVEDDDIAIRPNPVVNELQINNEWGETMFTLFDASGKSLQRFNLPKGVQRYDVSHLTPGVYYLFSERHRWLRKMVKG